MPARKEKPVSKRWTSLTENQYEVLCCNQRRQLEDKEKLNTVSRIHIFYMTMRKRTSMSGGLTSLSVGDTHTRNTMYFSDLNQYDSTLDHMTRKEKITYHPKCIQRLQMDLYLHVCSLCWKHSSRRQTFNSDWEQEKWCPSLQLFPSCFYWTRNQPDIIKFSQVTCAACTFQAVWNEALENREKACVQCVKAACDQRVLKY